MRPSKAFLLCAVLAACGTSADPEEAVRQWLADATEAAEARDRDRLIGMISERYADARGNDRDDIDRLLRLSFLRSHKSVLVSKIDELTMFADTAASVTLTVAMAGTESDVPGLSANACRFELELEKQKDGWRLIGARWGEFGQGLR